MQKYQKVIITSIIYIPQRYDQQEKKKKFKLSIKSFEKVNSGFLFFQSCQDLKRLVYLRDIHSGPGWAPQPPPGSQGSQPPPHQLNYLNILLQIMGSQPPTHQLNFNNKLLQIQGRQPLPHQPNYIYILLQIMGSQPPPHQLNYINILLQIQGNQHLQQLDMYSSVNAVYTYDLKSVSVP